jgi:triacylglycerol esterase/lipase EstA (alpha/beta hydrolase family)
MIDQLVFVPGFLANGKVFENLSFSKTAKKHCNKLHIFSRMIGSRRAERRLQLAYFLKSIPGKIHILTHSRGGPDMRDVLAVHPELCEKVLSVTMMAAPNGGSPVADWVVKNQEHELLSWLVDKINVEDLVEELTTWKMKEMNAQLKEAPVRWFAQPFFCKYRKICTDYAKKNYRLMQLSGLESDSTVPVESQTLYGEVLPIIEASHAAQIVKIPYGYLPWQTVSESVLEKVFAHIAKL